MAQLSSPNAPKSTFDTSNDIRKVVKEICLSAISHDELNGIKKNARTINYIFLLVLTISLSGHAMYCRFMYWGYSWNARDVLLTGLTSVSAIETIFSISTNVLSNVETYKEYYENYKKIDDVVLSNAIELYRDEQVLLNKIFFPPSFVFMLKVIVETILAFVTKPALQVLTFIDHGLTSSFNYVNHLIFFVQLIIFERRFEMFVKKAALTIPLGRVYKFQTDKSLPKCYQIFCKQNFILSRIYGFQVLFIFTYTILFVLLVLISVITEEENMFKDPVRVVSLILTSLLTGSVIVIIVRAVEKTSEARHRLILHLEDVLLSQSIDEENSLEITAFLNQVRRQPLEFSAHNICKLNYGTLLSQFSVTVTYAIILIQLKMF